MQMKPPSQLYRAGKLPVQVLRETTVQSTTVIIAIVAMESNVTTN